MTAVVARKPFRLLTELDHPRDAFAHVTPNWFAVVMGTGVVGVAAAALPVRLPGLRAVATVSWLLAAVLLVGLGWLTAQHWRHHHAVAAGHLDHPVAAHFYGAVPMAVLTVGTATLLVGSDVIGARAAVSVDWVLWPVGTLVGLVGAVLVPARMSRLGTVRRSDAFGGWLMSVVPPMVSASAGALLIPHLPAGSPRLALLIACYSFFALSLVASTVVIALVWSAFRTRGAGEARTVPTMWIVLGPLGQSITAAALLGSAAHLVVGPGPAAALRAIGTGYGLVVWALALAWATLALRTTIRTARTGLPFSLTWWSFTFPVGTVVTGTTGLAAHTGFEVFRVAAAGGWLVLLGAWVVVAVRTFHGAVLRGSLLAPPVSSGAAAR